ncbi:MAG: J domain-containing protein [Deltaproteobacteria bacterium]|jgi:DnaJ-class molecular chaperone
MKKYQEVVEARKMLELPERASIDEIKANYRSLIRQWHPDTSKAAKEECTAMSAKIAAAYAVIMDYCSHYEFSFSEEEIRYHLSRENWWRERFGNDPVWAN